MTERVLGGRYRVERKLGEGGMAEVWLARDLLEERWLALKLLRGSEDEGNRDYFMHEFRVLARLEHENLVRVFDFVDDPQGCFYTCEYLEGHDLFQATRELGLEDLYEVVRQVLEALAFVHDRGLVHYDVKPENVNVRAVAPARPGGRSGWAVKLVDFGLTGAATTTRGAKIKGTVHYVAPEVARSLPSDQRADLYSLGVSLYYVLTRKLPYDGGSAISIIRKHLEKVPEPPSQLRPDLPEAWAAFVLRLLEKDPARRYPSAPDALADLSRRLGKPYVAPPRPEGQRAALAPGFVGRKRELERLQALLPDRSRQTPPGVAWILGEEGLGKTRIVHELKVLGQLQGVPVLEAAQVEGGEPLRERVLRLLLTLPGARPLAEARREVLEALAPGILGGPPRAGDGPSLEELPGILDRAAEWALLLAAERPYALVVEDARRADEVSLGLVTALVRRLAFLREPRPAPLLVITDRPAPASLREGGPPPGMVEGSSAGGLGEGSASERLSGALEATRLVGRLESIELTGLSRAECGEMIASMLALPEPPDGLTGRVFEVSGGNPFFVMELVGSLLEEGLVALRQADLGPEQLARIDPPSSVAELLGQRLKRMPEETRVVLQALAVLEGQSGLELLARTAERSAEATLDALDVLLRRNLVQRLESERGPPSYQPAHAAVQRSVLRPVARAALEGFHKRALLALEALHPDGPAREAVVERLARHAWQGGDLPRALRYALAAGERARASGSAALAISHLERALDLLRWEEVVTEPAARRAQEAAVLTRLSEALTIAGRYRDAGQALEELLALGEDALDEQAGVWIRRRLGDLALRRGSPSEARRWLGEALQAAGDDPARRAERARVLEVMSRSTLWQGDYLQVNALAGEAAAIWRGLGRERDALWAVGILCIADYHRGQTANAARLLGEALRLIRGDGPGWQGALERLGLDPAAAQRFDRVLREEGASERALRRHAGDAYGLMLTFSELGAFFDFRAELPVARDFYAVLREASERRGDAQRTALSLNNLGVLDRQAGAYGRALEGLERALAIHEGTQDRPGAAVALMNLALLRLQLGELAGARARAERALAVAREIGITWLTGHGHRALGRVLAAQGLTLEGDRELGRAAGVFRLIGNPRSLLDVLLDRIEIACAAGDLEQARALSNRARAQGGDDPPLDFVARERLSAGELTLLADPRRAVDAWEAALRAATRAGIAELELEARRGLALAGLHLGLVRMASEHHTAAQALERRLLAGVDAALQASWSRTPGAQRGREIDRQLEERLLDG